MNELIEAIRVATTEKATAEQKATGAQACRTIIAALGAEPGKPLTLPGMPATAPVTRPSLDQMLDIVIARLTAIANKGDASTSAATPPRGLRVPTVAAVTPRAAGRSPTVTNRPTTRNRERP